MIQPETECKGFEIIYEFEEWIAQFFQRRWYIFCGAPRRIAELLASIPDEV